MSGQRLTRDGRYISPEILVEVTQDDIDSGKRRNSHHCPNAEAVRRAVSKKFGEEVTGVMVDLQTIRFSVPSRRLRYVYLTPRPAQVLVIDFDQGNEPKPCAFKLRAGQVTYMGTTHLATVAKESLPHYATPEAQRERAERRKEAEASPPRKTAAQPARHRAQLTRSPNGNLQTVPGISGGRPPPVHKAANGRGFGLRRFGVY